MRHRLIRKLLVFCGIDQFKDTDDRHVLERIVFPYFVQRSEFSKILFVGCSWYTRGYKVIFRDKDYWTLDILASKRKYGAKNHIHDSLENLPLSFREGELDLIICNGVFGRGLNDPDNIETAFRGCSHCLREGGLFVLGWNDVPGSCPLPLEECQSLKLFDRYVFPPLSTSQYLTANPNRHTYSFYTKPRGAAAARSAPS